jgi:DNA-binding NarL/FixJ family response regulator
MTIQLFVSDKAVLSSLEFSLAAEGLPASDGEGSAPQGAVAAVVIDRGDLGASLAFLTELRSEGCTAPAIVLATHPNARQRANVAAAGAALIEKPLLGDQLTFALRSALRFEKAA